MVKGQCYWSDGVILSGFFLLLGWHPKCPGPCRPPWSHLTNTPPPGRPSVPGTCQAPHHGAFEKCCLLGGMRLLSLFTYLPFREVFPDPVKPFSVCSPITEFFHIASLWLRCYIYWCIYWMNACLYPYGSEGKYIPCAQMQKRRGGDLSSLFLPSSITADLTDLLLGRRFCACSAQGLGALWSAPRQASLEGMFGNKFNSGKTVVTDAS